MSVLRQRRKLRAGFTIVELLIVIVVIAILAAISVVAYTGIQARANDSKMISAAIQIEKALKLYAVDNGTAIRGGYGSTAVASGNACVDGTGGFFGSGSYACTVEDTLVGSGLLPSGFTAALPSNAHFTPNSDGRNTLMFYTCGGGANRYALYWSLRSPTASDTASLENTLTTCGNSVLIRDNWGMRAGKIVQL